MSLLAASFSCTGGGGSDPAAVNAKYIDPSPATPDGGDGSQNSPYNSFEDVTFEAGTSYLIKRGTVLKEQITINASGTASAPIVIGAYGDTALALPVIDGSIPNVASGWTPVSGNIYKKQITLSPGAPGNVADSGSMLKSVAWNGEEAITIAAMTKGSYSFNPADNTFYIWRGDDTAPDADITISSCSFGIDGTGLSYIIIENLRIRQASRHGIHFEDSDHITIQYCIIEMCGGEYLGQIEYPPSSGTYIDIFAGNGVEFGNSSSYCTVTGCTVSQIFDSGVTCQTYDNNMTASDFIFSSNTISTCGFAGVEIAVLSVGGTKSGSSISGVSVTGNTISGCGDGFSGVRYGNEGQGIKIKADFGAGSMSGVGVEQCTVKTCENGIFAGGNVNEVIVNRCRLESNTAGISVYDNLAVSNLKLKVTSSLLLTNTVALVYNALDGDGFELYNNTFYNNAWRSLWIVSQSGTAIMKNNILYSSNTIEHIYSVTLLNPDIDYNCYFNEGTGFINYNSAAYDNLAGFQDGTPFDDHSTASDPSFDSNYKPASVNCNDDGTPISGVAYDYYGNLYHSTNPAIGAVEY